MIVKFTALFTESLVADDGPSFFRSRGDTNQRPLVEESRNQTTDSYVLSDTDRFYILMEPLYGLVDPESPVEGGEPQTPEDVRRAIAHRAAKVRAVLKPVAPTPDGGNA